MSTGYEFFAGPGSQRDTLIKIAHEPTFPFFQIKLIKDEGPTSIDLPVSPEIYDKLIETYQTDELTLYYSINLGTIQVWGDTMIFSIQTLSKLDLMSLIPTWTSNSRKFIIHNITGTSEEIDEIPDEVVERRLSTLKELLEYSGIKDEVDSNKELFSIARDVARTNLKDPDSIIYRLAMMVYHGARLTGKLLIPQIEDPGSISLALLDNEEFKEKYTELYNELNEFSLSAKSKYLKTLTSFIIGAYLYYSAIYG